MSTVRRTARSTIDVRWNPADYAPNSTMQLAWARELIGKLQLRGDERVLDVGCGDGKVTAELARAVTSGQVTGVDSSSVMVRFARASFPGSEFPNLRFHEMDARQLHFDAPFDLIFSNAALHWVDDHAAFLRGAASCLRPGGRLAISCGGKGNAQDVFAAVRAVLRTKRFRQYFRQLSAAYFFHRPEDYELWLPRSGFEPRTVQLAEKISLLKGRDDFAAWFRTTWLPYTQRVPEPLRDEFGAAVVDRYLANHPPEPDGRVSVKMMRLEIDATRLGTPGIAAGLKPGVHGRAELQPAI